MMEVVVGIGGSGGGGLEEVAGVSVEAKVSSPPAKQDEPWHGMHFPILFDSKIELAKK